MDAAGRALARAQLDGHRAIDAVYAPLAEAVAALVLRLAANGLIPPGARFAFRRDLERLLIQAEPGLALVVARTAADAATAVHRLHGIERAAPPDVAVLATALAGLQRNRANVLAQADALLLRGALRGLPAATVAKTAGDYFSPFFAARRDAAGELRRAGRVGAVRSWPGESGMASQFARAEVLTRATEAHATATLEVARDRRLGVKYNLSYKHLERDACTENARRDVGFGPGRYRAWPISEAPLVPVHRRCRCYLSTVELPEGAA